MESNLTAQYLFYKYLTSMRSKNTFRTCLNFELKLNISA